MAVTRRQDDAGGVPPGQRVLSLPFGHITLPIVLPMAPPMALLIALLIASGLAGCAGPRPAPSSAPAPTSTPRPLPLPPLRPQPDPVTPMPDRDGPGANPPPDLLHLPDAQPRVEAPRSGGPNKPYEVLGQAYVPLAGDPPLVERGLASWYGRKFHGRPTANGEIYDMYAMTAAHKTMPLPSYARVRNPANGREVVVRINDRGPFAAGRVIDLSYTAALKLGLLAGVAPVELERITFEAIRTGSWRQAPAGVAAADADPPGAMPREQAPTDTPQAVATGEDPIGDLAQRLALPSPPPSPSPLPASPSPSPALGYWLQLGAFRDGPSAQAWRQQLLQRADWLKPWLAVFGDEPWHRVQAGPYATRPEALAAAQRLRELLRLAPMLVQRR